MGASTDSVSAYNTMGSGLQRRDDGLLVVTDPTQAFMQTAADGTSDYARLDVTPLPQHPDADVQRNLRSTFHIRLDSDNHVGRSTSVNTDTPRSLYVRTTAHHIIRLWVQEPIGTIIPLTAVRANIHVPWSLDWWRVGVMAAIACCIALWNPFSRWWRIPLNTTSRRQRWALGLALGAVGVATAVSVVRQIMFSAPLVFHQQGGYTYDFDQYGHIADALLHGHTWLDLPVPEALANVDNPYDVATRNQLLAQGVSPVYWDYAFYQGHWYSYFGVLPAVILFVPYRLFSSLWIKGGAMLPTSCAVLLLMFAFAVFACLLTIRCVRWIWPHTSLASVTMAIAVVLLASNASYLWFRTNFYSVPIAASLALSCCGLWLWMGAVRGSLSTRGATDWHVGRAPALSLPHVAGGAACIAANFGCRPSFCLTALLALPMFWPQIRTLLSQWRRGVVTWRTACRAPLSMIVPAALVVAPLAAYNAARFGSPWNFGNTYQITVADMTARTTSWDTILPTIGYYLCLPVRLIGQFPFIALSPTPLPQWGFAEPMVGGLFMLCPLCSLALFLPIMRQRLRYTGCWGIATSMLGLSLALMLFDAYEGGLGWRYMADFGWLMALASLPVLLRVVNYRPLAAHRRGGFDTDLSHTTWKLTTQASRPIAVRMMMAVRRTLVAALLAAGIAVTIGSWLVIGRDDALIANAPTLWHDIQSWLL